VLCCDTQIWSIATNVRFADRQGLVSERAPNRKIDESRIKEDGSKRFRWQIEGLGLLSEERMNTELWREALWLSDG
jgi:hypothetical protein